MAVHYINPSNPRTNYNLKPESRITTFNKNELKKELNDLINAGLTLSSASKYLAKKNGLKKSQIYNLD